MERLYRIYKISTYIADISGLITLISLFLFKFVELRIAAACVVSIGFISIISRCIGLISQNQIEKAIEKDKAEKSKDRAGKFNIF